MTPLLLDTNALIWFDTGGSMSEDALLGILAARKARTLYVSPITAWEAALAVQKKNPARRPNLGKADPASWFREARRKAGVKLVLIGSQIALEAARVPALLGSGDPGDCYIVATARVKELVVVTRDRAISALFCGAAGLS